MKISINIAEKNYSVNLDNPIDISIPVQFDGKGLTAFGAPAASGVAYEAGDYIGDVRQGGSCNCEVLTFAPHLHGTHTECVGHISKERIYIADVFAGGMLPATVITLLPEFAESYDPVLRPEDNVLSAKSIKSALEGFSPDFLDALIVRTSPNLLSKRVGQYEGDLPPFFSIEAMKFICELGVKHLLIDTPSVDRLDDEGKLSNHHIYWNVEQGSNDVDFDHLSTKTITELIYVPDSVADGNYILDLQVAGFMMDAAPSRPILYEVLND